MGMMKHEHHEEILKRDKTENPAEEEYYSEQRRHAANKARQEKEEAQGKSVPVAPPVEIVFEGRRTYMADPATEAKRFETACREADLEAKKSGDNIAVFKNREGNFFTWEEKYISSANPIEVLYMAHPPAPKKEAK
jgi:hypothetical protein